MLTPPSPPPLILLLLVDLFEILQGALFPAKFQAPQGGSIFLRSLIGGGFILGVWS